MSPKAYIEPTIVMFNLCRLSLTFHNLCTSKVKVGSLHGNKFSNFFLSSPTNDVYSKLPSFSHILKVTPRFLIAFNSLFIIRPSNNLQFRFCFWSSVFAALIKDSRFDSATKLYLKTIFPTAPAHFIVAKHHVDLRRHGKPESLFKHVHGTVPVQINGPKGVGKTMSLFGFALELAISNTQQDTTILYVSANSSENIFMDGYLQYNGLNCKFATLAETILSSTGRRFILCVDFGEETSSSNLPSG